MGPALLIAVIVLLLLSGFFSSMETAYSCSNKLKLKTMITNGNQRAAKVLRLADEKYDSFLSTILVGNNIVNITTTTLAGILFAERIANASLAETVSTIVTTIAVLIFGEITPKMIAKVYPEKMAMAGYPLIMFFTVILYPINMAFAGYKFILSKIFKLKNTEVVTEDEIMTMVEEARVDGTLKQDETKLIRSVIEFDDLEVGDILIPRVNIVAISVETPFDKIRDLFRDTGYSRLPVYKGTIDTVIGILHEKDFFNLYFSEKKNLVSAMHAVTYTTEHIKISVLLKQLQKEKTHMAIVLDEYGGTLGIITLEDILEELVGEIWDEHDKEIVYFRHLTEDTDVVNAEADLSDFFNYYGFDEDEYDYDANTVSGWVIEQLGEIPPVGTKFVFGNVTVEVTKASVKKVIEVKVTKLLQEEEEDPEKSKEKKIKQKEDEEPEKNKEKKSKSKDEDNEKQDQN